MTRAIGFSTGALTQGDFQPALQRLQRAGCAAVELSALRDTELDVLLEILPTLSLQPFTYISVHAPSRFVTLSEVEVLERLRNGLPADWPIIVHPDSLTKIDAWRSFGAALCIENMDKRKAAGRTVAELTEIFELLPNASFCFDIGHARQIDPTMSQAASMLKAFGGRLRQLHVSEVNSRSGHDPLTFAALSAFRKVVHLIPPGAPLILETPVEEAQMPSQIALVEEAFAIPRTRAI